MPSIKPFDITLRDINLLLDQMREAITTLHYDAEGRPIYGYIDAAGVSHELGMFGDFDPIDVIDAVTGFSGYDGAWEVDGFDISTEFFNDLSDSTCWSWGAVNDPFPRLTEADYIHYLTQVLTNPVLTKGLNAGYIELHSVCTDSDASTTLATPSAQFDADETAVDYAPRMITQTNGYRFRTLH